METEMIDKLFLKLSQVSKATTERELALQKLLKKAFRAGFEIGYSPVADVNKIEDEWDRFVKWHELEDVM